MNHLMGLSLLAEAVYKVVDNGTGEAASLTKVPAAASSGLDLGWKLLMLVALCVLPYVAGAFVARAMRLKEFSNRIGTVLLAFTLGLAPFVFHMVKERDVGAWKNAMHLGIDLAGGTNLIYSPAW